MSMVGLTPWLLDSPLWGVPPSDPGQVCPPEAWVPLWAARHVPDTRSDESEAAEALDLALEGALRSDLSPLECGVIRRRYWNGWTWEQIGQYYSCEAADRSSWAEIEHDRALAKLRRALR